MSTFPLPYCPMQGTPVTWYGRQVLTALSGETNNSQWSAEKNVIHSRCQEVQVFQLGIFLRALRPAHTVLHPAQLSSALPELFIKQFFFFSFSYLQNVIAVFVFSDNRCKNACNCLQICVHVFINRPQNCAHADLVSFTCWIVTKFWSFTRKSVPHLVIRALNCARFCVVCALNCAQILVVRVLDCARFLLNPTLFPT